MQHASFLRVATILAVVVWFPDSWQSTASTAIGQTRQDAGAPGGTGVFMGRVVDADSKAAIQGAVVSLSPTGAGTPIEPVLTDDQGRFAFLDLRAGSYQVRARHAGYVDGTYAKRLPDEEAELDGRPLVLREDERIGDATLLMWKHASISGTLIDEAGEPLVDVPVRVMRRRILAGRPAFDVVVNGVRTDDRGVFRAGELPPGDFIVALPVVVGSMPRPSSSEDPAATRAAYNLSMGAMRVPAADIGDPDAIFAGHSAGAATLSAFAGLDRDGRPLVYATLFFPGVTRLRDAALITLRAGEERFAITVQARPVRGMRVSGTVVSADGPPGALVLRLVPADFAALGTDVEIAQARCTPDGRFVFLGVPAGEYSILIDRSEPGGRAVLFANTALSVGNQDVSGVTVPLRPGVHVRGRTRYESTAPTTPPRFGVYIESADGTVPTNQRLQTTQIDAQGGFVTSGRRPGLYILRVMLASAPSSRGWFFKGAMVGGRDISVVPVELGDADVDDVVLTFSDKPNAEITGVVSGANGPDASASVMVFPVDRERWTNTGRRPRALRLVGTDSNGHYQVSDLPPGEYFVAASTGAASSTWADPASLQAIARTATRVQVADGEKKVLELRLK
jgi:hypothetical protein